MAKLKNIIKQLSEKDFKAIHDSLIESNAEKSAYLLKSLRERQLSDNKIMSELEVNANAYYTLRSRLNLKIEEYLMGQLESPRTDVLRKVANITEVLFTKKKAISVATLKKLEKELLDYDLANELTVIYKSLKKLNINSPDYFQYSQLYNRHVAYMLAVDKAEDLLADYFKKYGDYMLNGGDVEKLGQRPAIEARQHDEQRRQDAPDREAPADDAGEDRHVGAGRPSDLRALALGDEVAALLGEVAGGVADDSADLGGTVLEEEEVERDADEVRRARGRDLRVAPDDERVGVVAGMAPAVVEGLPQRHEGAEMKEYLIEPPRLERRSMGQFVMPVIGRGIEDAIDGEGGDAPERAPRRTCCAAPDGCLSCCWTAAGRG